LNDNNDNESQEWLKIIGWKIDKKSWYLLSFEKMEFYKNWKVKSFIVLTDKQKIAWEQLAGDVFQEVLYWGAVWWWKSFVGCLFVVIDCLLNRKVRYLIGRRQNSDLVRTTIGTLHEVLDLLWMKEGVDFKKNSKENFFRFKNKSEIVYMNLQKTPKDPLFNRLWGLELTGYFLDEAQEIDRQAVIVLRSRKRKTHLIENWKLIRKKIWKWLYTCNPWKNFVYTDFYLPHKKKELDKTKSFIFSSPFDNPNLSDDYIKNLKDYPKSDYERLVKWNFDYDNDPMIMIWYDSIMNMFLSEDIITENEQNFLSIDLSWKWKDKTVIMVWKWMNIVKIITKTKTNWKELIPEIEELEKKYKIKRKNVVVDSDWVWENFIDYFPWHFRFKWGYSPISPRYVSDEEKAFLTKYRNLRTQCYFLLADKIENEMITVRDDQKHFKDNISTELWFLKEVLLDNGVKSIESKQIIKSNLGHSPDFADAMMMRMVFEVWRNKKRVYEFVCW